MEHLLGSVALCCIFTVGKGDRLGSGTAGRRPDVVRNYFSGPNHPNRFALSVPRCLIAPLLSRVGLGAKYLVFPVISDHFRPKPVIAPGKLNPRRLRRPFDKDAATAIARSRSPVGSEIPSGRLPFHPDPSHFFPSWTELGRTHHIFRLAGRNAFSLRATVIRFFTRRSRVSIPFVGVFHWGSGLSPTHTSANLLKWNGVATAQDLDQVSTRWVNTSSASARYITAREIRALSQHDSSQHGNS